MSITKKEINRFKKSDLIRMVKEKGLPCNTKMSKRELVECVFKHKELRNTLQAPPKRQLSEKQKANLSKFRLGSDYKNEKLIKPEAQYDAELKKIENVKQKPSGSVAHSEELKQVKEEEARKVQVREKEYKDSTTKTTDEVDGRVLQNLEEPVKVQILEAQGLAQTQGEKRYGENQVPPNIVDISTYIVYDANGKPSIDLGKVAKLKEDVLRGHSTSQQANTYAVLSMLIERAKQLRISKTTQIGAETDENLVPPPQPPSEPTGELPVGGETSTTMSSSGGSLPTPIDQTGISSGRSEGREGIERIAGEVIKSVSEGKLEVRDARESFMSRLENELDMYFAEKQFNKLIEELGFDKYLELYSKIPPSVVPKEAKDIPDELEPRIKRIAGEVIKSVSEGKLDKRDAREIFLSRLADELGMYFLYEKQEEVFNNLIEELGFDKYLEQLEEEKYPEELGIGGQLSTINEEIIEPRKLSPRSVKLENMTNKELREILKKEGKSHKGGKLEMIDRIKTPKE